MDGRYESMEIEVLGEGRLRFFDPVPECNLRSHEEDMGRAEEERAGRMAVEERVETAEARVADLEE